jgi:hypothetical protein
VNTQFKNTANTVSSVSCLAQLGDAANKISSKEAYMRLYNRAIGTAMEKDLKMNFIN